MLIDVKYNHNTEYAVPMCVTYAIVQYDLKSNTLNLSNLICFF